MLQRCLLILAIIAFLAAFGLLIYAGTHIDKSSFSNAYITETYGAEQFQQQLYYLQLTSTPLQP